MLNRLRKVYWKWRWRPYATEAARLLRIEVSRRALLHNVAHVQARVPGQRLIAVLKSNAYGHGLGLVGRVMETCDSVEWLAVDSIVEARDLRSAGIRKPILIIDYVPRAAIPALRLLSHVALHVTSFEQARWLSERVDFPLCVHVKVDTGMHRQGVAPEEVKAVIELLQSNAFLDVGGLSSHLADADSANAAYTQRQLACWNEVVLQVRPLLPEHAMLHIAATAGTHHLEGVPSTHVRLGIGLYGFDPVAHGGFTLQPALSLFAKITHIKLLAAGEACGYNATFVAPADMTVAVIPIGYQEGLWRAVSSKGVVSVRGTACPVVGRVSMNMSTIDVSRVIPAPQLEEEVEVISRMPDKGNSVERLAAACSTIPYEVLVGLDSGISRTLVE